MKNGFKKLTALLMLYLLLMSTLLLPVSAADTGEFDPPGNLVKNPGFEYGFNLQAMTLQDWDLKGPGIILPAQNPVHSGQYSLSLYGNIVNPALPNTLSQKVSIEESGLYELSAYVYLDQTKSVNAKVNLSIGTVRTEMKGVYNQWVRVSLPFYAGHGEKTTLSIHKDGGPVTIDDVCVVKVEDDRYPHVLQNSDFEDGYIDWDMTGTKPSFYTTGSEAHSGSASLFMAYFGEASADSGLEHKFSFHPGNGGGTLVFTAYVKTRQPLTGPGVIFSLETMDYSGEDTASFTGSSEPVTDTGGEWQAVTIQFSIPDYFYGNMKLSISAAGSMGGFYIDDAVLVYLQES